MTILPFVRRAAWICGLTASLAACGGTSSPQDPTPTPPPTWSPTATLTSTPEATPTATHTATVVATATLTATATATHIPAAAFAFAQPQEQELRLAGSVTVTLDLPAAIVADSLRATLDDVALPMSVAGEQAHATVSDIGAGTHVLRATVQALGGQELEASVHFEAITLDRPDECEVLNDGECLLPYPSSRFLEEADTPTGWRIKLPQTGMPVQNGRPIPIAPYNQNDGFSPTAQILMLFPGGVDVEASNAPRLLPATRSSDSRSLDADSPTVLLDADTGERILHFVENDVRATDPSRRVLFLRPGKSLTPGHRYLVAVRALVHEDGSPIVAEPVFAALRDQRPIGIASVAERRARFEDIFTRLADAGVDRSSLVLAFDFVVASDANLTAQMLAMRDESFAWLHEVEEQGTKTFTVDRVVENDCTQPGTVVWRTVEGTYQVPLFLRGDPVTNPTTPTIFNLGEDGMPAANGFTHPPFTIGIPCSALAESSTPTLPLVLGHGLFGDGRGFVSSIADVAGDGFNLIAGATDWRGLSAPDIAGDDLTRTFIGRVILQLQNFPAMPDRLRQGQLNTLVLARMMRHGSFNQDPAFQRPSGEGVFVGPEHEAFYLGGSLGGIMGLMFGALSPDVTNLDVVVPAINFSLLLQRATPFLAFQSVFELGGITDPAQQALLLGLLHELWVRGESAGYATHITSNPLPGTNAKNVLMTSAFLDQQVSNQGTEIAARTLGLPSLVGSLQSGLAQIPDLDGPLTSALVMYDTGSFVLDNPEHAPFIPPLSNLQAEPNRCDPHGLQAIIPAAVQQIAAFLRPGGQIENFCNGICDADGPHELPNGSATPCQPIDAPTPTPVPDTLSFDFRDGELGWEPIFVDYPVADQAIYELEAGIRPLPSELLADGTGFLLGGNNHSDDLAMLLRRQLGSADGIQPGQAYRAHFTIQLASNAQSGCIGIGGAPGESVFLKAGGSATPPVAILEEGWARLNLDKGNQAAGGADLSTLGDIANGVECDPGLTFYVPLTKTHTHEPITAGPDGTLWIILGTDSGFEGRTSIYLRQIDVRLEPLA